MKFLDYEKIIRDKYPILIESYVRQYGEQYREHIIKVLDGIKYCFFVSPINLSGYITQKKGDDLRKAILESYKELDLNTSGVCFDEDGFLFKDVELGLLTLALFPDTSSLEKIKNKGVFAFADKFDNLSYDDPIIKERIEVLENLNLKKHDISILDYVISEDYDKYCNWMKKVLGIVSKNIDKYCSEDYSMYMNYLKELENKINDLAQKYEREYLNAVSEFLCLEDQEKLKDENVNIKDLRDYYLFFDDEEEREEYSFSDGVLKFFCEEYTDMLLDKTVSFNDKKDIVDMRLKYLKKHDVEITDFEYEELFCDWYEIEELKDELPNSNDVSAYLLIRDKYKDKYKRDMAQTCIINDYVLDINASEIETILDSTGHSFSFVVSDEEFDIDNPVLVVCLSPLEDLYNFFDIYLDHELRHAIELCMKKEDGKIIVKVGSDISYFSPDFVYRDGGCTNYNEILTQKLSVQATYDRWMRGEFILSDPYVLRNCYSSSAYDYDIDNLDIIFEPFKKELIDAQISPDFDKIYEIIPEKTLRKIDAIIVNHSESAERKLQNIRKQLIKRNKPEIDTEKVKTLNRKK